MEKLICSYNPLFSVELWHDYYLEFYTLNNPFHILNQLPANFNVNNFFEIKPSLLTEKLLSNYGLIFKLNNKGFTVYGQSIKLAGGDINSVIPIDLASRFSFELYLKDSYFFNYTSIPFIKSPDLFYFNNLEDNSTNDGLYLFKSLDDYDSSQSYKLGDLVVDSDKVYESIADSSNTGGLNSTTKWRDTSYKISIGSATLVAGVHAVFKKDITTLVKENYYYHRANHTPNSLVNFTVKNIRGNAVNLGNQAGTNFPQSPINAPAIDIPFLKHTLNLSHLENGKYTLEEGGDTYEFYLFNNRQKKQPFGLIEIFGDTSTKPYQFIESTGVSTKINYKVYKLRFKNRVTKWRYYLQGDISVAPAREVHFPFSYNYFKVTDKLPNANHKNIQAKKKNNSNELEALCSDIYLYDITI